MNNVAIFKHSDCLLHVSNEAHVEKPERVIRILKLLSDNVQSSWTFRDSSFATEKDILRVHTKSHWESLHEAISRGDTILDQGDTYACENSILSALRAAGSVIDAVNAVVSGEFHRVFCCVRPPGHHAESNKVMGFCLFNSIAVGARYAIKEKGFKRVMIIDWDVHHGNGTQEIFAEDPSVFFISLHQHPLYPGTGMVYETGTGLGAGFTKNFPQNPGTRGETYVRIFKNEIADLVRSYKPEILFISAGFDAHREDPLADINLETADYSKLTSILCALANEVNAPIVSVLEGGYNLEATAESVLAHVNAMSLN